MRVVPGQEAPSVWWALQQWFRKGHWAFAWLCAWLVWGGALGQLGGWYYLAGFGVLALFYALDKIFEAKPPQDQS